MDDVLNYIKDDSEDFYAILGCDPSSTEEQIICEYRARVLDCHPDKNPEDPEAAERFQKLQRAKDILCDSSKRGNYDRWRRSQLSISYSQWSNMAPTQMSTHWASTKPQPMINSADNSNKKSPSKPKLSPKNKPKPVSVPVSNLEWFNKDSSSELIQKFRNYEI